MIAISVLQLVLLLGTSAADRGETLLKESEDLSRSNQTAAALAKAEQAVVELDAAHAAGESLSWQAMNGLRLAARLAREDLLDFDKSMFFCLRLSHYADGDYWNVPAQLEMALTYRAHGQYNKAKLQYDAIAAAEPRYQATMLLPYAEMLLYELGDQQRGRELLTAALNNDAVNGRERFSALRKAALDSIEKGDRDEALAWYTMLEKLPFEKADEHARYLCQAWYEMGKIEESLGRTQQAKQRYRQAMEMELGNMRDRARARDALESIEYFE